MTFIHLKTKLIDYKIFKKLKLLNIYHYFFNDDKIQIYIIFLEISILGVRGIGNINYRI